MIRTPRWCLVAAAVLAHQVEAQPATPEHLAESLVAAERAHDSRQRLALLHPSSRACHTPQTQAYFDWIYSRRAKLVAAGARKPRVSVAPLDGVSRPNAEGSEYPIRPTHQLTIDLSPTAEKHVSLVVLAVRQGGRWVEVLPCPRRDTVLAAAASDTARRERESDLRQRLAALREPLRAKLVALARDGRRIDAIHEYRAATGVDLATAKDVIDALVPR